MASTLLLLLLLLTAALPIISARPTSSATRCEDCGSTPVPYPLSTAPNCGDQSYKIRCDAGKLYLNTSNNTYTIFSISPETQRLVIGPASFTNDNQTCVTTDFPTNGVQLDPTQPFTITSSNTIMFFNCSDTLLRSPPPMNCTPTSLCHSYLNGSAEASACVAAPICCTFRAGGSYYSIAVSEGGCQAYRSFVNLDHSSAAVSGWPDPGVQIQWVSPPEPACSTQADCDSQSTCGAGSGGVCRCLCNTGFRWDPIAASCSSGFYGNVTMENQGDYPVKAAFETGGGTNTIEHIIGTGESLTVQFPPHKPKFKIILNDTSETGVVKLTKGGDGQSACDIPGKRCPMCFLDPRTTTYFCNLHR